MKQILMILVVLFALAFSAAATDCPNTAFDCVDIGNATSMAAHDANRWGEPNYDGIYDYGGFGGDNTIGVIWEISCPGVPDINDDANADLDSGSAVWETVKIRYLDSHFGADSYVFSLEGLQVEIPDDDSNEDTWKTAEIDVSSLGLTGRHKFKVANTEEPGPQCKLYGQVAVNWASLDVENDVPEFSVIAASLAGIGATAGFLMLRRRK
jgi:hypothetical protein